MLRFILLDVRSCRVAQTTRVIPRVEESLGDLVLTRGVDRADASQMRGSLIPLHVRFLTLGIRR